MSTDYVPPASILAPPSPPTPFANPPAPPPQTWLTVAEVVEALGVSQRTLESRLYLVNPRVAQLADGSQQVQIAASTVWRLADRFGVPLPARFPRP